MAPKLLKFKCFYLSSLLLFLLSLPIPLLADNQQIGSSELTGKPAKIYRSPEERREAGLGTQLTDWLMFSGLVEIEKEYKKNNFDNGLETTVNGDIIPTIQLGLDFSFADWLEAEFIYEAEYDRRFNDQIDEALIAVDIGKWGIKFGRQFPAFGEYYSHFVTGPLLEFGEIRKTSIIVDYSFNDQIEVSGFVFEGDIDKIGNNNEYDWGLSFEYVSGNEALRIGASYLSDLAETDEKLLEETISYERRVSGWSAYLLIGMNEFEVTAEMVHALRAFDEFDSDADKPSSYNVELAYFPTQSVQLAMRIENSDELEDQPEWQYGAAVTWRIANLFNLTVDYLYGDFKNGFVLDDDDNELDHRHLIAAQVALEF